MIGLASIGLVSVGCSSSNGGGTGKAGAGGSAGNSGGTGGGAGAGGAGAGGTGGGVAAAHCGLPQDGGGYIMTDVVASTSPLIADFMGGDGSTTAGIEIGGQIITYGGTGAPTATPGAGMLVIKESHGGAAAAQYVGAGIGFTDCVDASAFTGVEYTIGGSFSGCTIQYSTLDSEHTDVTTADHDPKGTGAAGDYSPQAAITSLTSSGATIQVPFTATGAPANGLPTGTIDPKLLTGVQWQFTIAATADGGTAADCEATLNISELKFY